MMKELEQLASAALEKIAEIQATARWKKAIINVGKTSGGSTLNHLLRDVEDDLTEIRRAVTHQGDGEHRFSFTSQTRTHNLSGEIRGTFDSDAERDRWLEEMNQSHIVREIISSE